MSIDCVTLLLLCLCSRLVCSESACCQKLFLSAQEVLDREQGALLGLYSLEANTSFAGKPIYSKRVGQFAFYFFFKPNGTVGIDSPGWTVSSEPGGRSLNIVTRASKQSCPVGIAGAYDRDLELDSTFRVECLDKPMVRTKICCPKLLFNATDVSGPVGRRQPALLGVYTKNGSFNDHDVYLLDFHGFKSFLYQRRLGRASDGWTISQVVGSESFAITTRDRSECPSQIQTVYERNRDKDDKIEVKCVHNTTDVDIVNEDIREANGAKGSNVNFFLFTSILSLLAPHTYTCTN